jgi:hypothetical protein
VGRITTLSGDLQLPRGIGSELIRIVGQAQPLAREPNAVPLLVLIVRETPTLDSGDLAEVARRLLSVAAAAESGEAFGIVGIVPDVT